MSKFFATTFLCILLYSGYTYNMTHQVINNTPEPDPPIYSLEPVYPTIASFLSWPDILRMSSTSKYLNETFVDPAKPITLNYSEKCIHQENAAPLLQKIYEDILNIHKKNKYYYNRISLLFRNNQLSEKENLFYNFNNVLQKLYEEKCTKQIQMIDLSFNYMLVPPASLTHYQKIKEIAYFGNNPIPFLHCNTHFPSLGKLGFSLYPNIPPESLEKWKQLRKLYLDVPIQSIPSTAITQIAKLMQLKKLYLQGTEFQKIVLFDTPINCRRTSLEADQLEEISHLPNLQHLVFTHFNINNFAQMIQNFKQLRKLQLSLVNFLSDQELSNPASVIFDDSTSRWIANDDVTFVINPEDHLDQICQGAQHLDHLESINLSSNQLQFLPTSIIFLNRIKHLDLYNNDLRTLPSELAHLINLHKLNIAIRPEAENLIADLHMNPELLANLPRLRCLHLLARRPLTNDLPLLKKLVRIRQDLSQDTDHIQTITDKLTRLTDNPELCTQAAQHVAFLAATLHLLEPTVSRTQLASTENLIDQLAQIENNPQEEALIEFLQSQLEKAQNEQETFELPKKRQRTSKNTYKKR